MRKPKSSSSYSHWHTSPMLGSLSFWSPHSTFESLEYSWIIFVFVGIFLAFYVAGKFRKQKCDPMLVTLDDNDFIDVILRRSIEVEARFDILCDRQGLLQKYVQGHCKPLSPKNAQGKKCAEDNEPQFLTINLHAGALPAGWDNAPIDVYFQIITKGVPTYYHFATFVHRIYQEDGQSFMDVIRPSILSDSQSKETMRIEPEPEMVAMASAWIYPSEPLIMPTEVSKLGSAHAIFRPEGNSDFHIVYISADGIRLRFVRDHMETLPCHFEKNGQACLLLVLNSQDEALSRIPLWLKATCPGFSPSDDKECVDARFSFTHWQQISKRSPHIQWYPATDKDRVPPLMHWIMHEVLQVQQDTHVDNKPDLNNV